jgi:L-alanine-DL-glutamate epimerase-like enolase superfamily enzyme
MRITRVETMVINMPMTIDGAVPRMGPTPVTSMYTLLVRLDTDEGLTGWGEGFGHRIYAATKAAIDTVLAPLCIGRNALDRAGLIGDIKRSLVPLGRDGPTMFALSAIDIALWDLAGKAVGEPVYRLLGGPVRTELPVYASVLHYGNAADLSHRIDRLLRRGYRRLKVHEYDPEPIEAARDVAGPEVPLMVDCVRHWDVEAAITMARKLQHLDLVWLEEPLYPPDDHVGLARVRREGGIATAAGENAQLPDLQRLVDTSAIDYLQPSVTKIGGISELLKVSEIVAGSRVSLSPHSAYFGPGLIATIHFLAATANDVPVERYDADFAMAPLQEAINPDERGLIRVPQGPGLGVDPDPAVIRRLRVE